MDAIFINLIGVGLIGLIVWFFWLSKPAATIAPTTETGIQEIGVIVKGGYTPDTIQVEAGRPVRLTFNRQESDPCSETVILDAFGLSADLPQGADVSIEFTPSTAGDYEFACQMGMLRGTVVVT